MELVTRPLAAPPEELMPLWVAQRRSGLYVEPDARLQGTHKPNFFILGAAKCGTTSLYHYLECHPEIFMAREKEPTFFCRSFQVVSNPVDYLALFDRVTTERVIGEASHAYLSDPSTARVLKALFPAAKLLIILRHPADRAYSLYHHMRRHGLEPIGSFEKALAAEEKRAASRRFRERCPHYLYNYLYFRSGLFGEQVERYLSLFDRDQIHILTLDELRRDPQYCLAEILRFLGVNARHTPWLRAYNQGRRTARLAWLQYLWTQKVTRPRGLHKLGLGVLKCMNLEKVPPMHPETRAALAARYRDDLDKLHALTGIRF